MRTVPSVNFAFGPSSTALTSLGPGLRHRRKRRRKNSGGSRRRNSPDPGDRRGCPVGDGRTDSIAGQTTFESWDSSRGSGRSSPRLPVAGGSSWGASSTGDPLPTETEHIGRKNEFVVSPRSLLSNANKTCHLKHAIAKFHLWFFFSFVHEFHLN